jgi:DNA (cytosine-5)-methyltransferase 1
VTPRILDLFAGAGGATRGYQLAGFHVTGVDIAPQPRYCGDEFHQADAMTFPLDGYDAIHASPPCQDHSSLTSISGTHGTGWMLPATRERLSAQPAPWVIENVPGAPMRTDYRLCGCMFGLDDIRRERWFETSWCGFALNPPHHHFRPAISVTGTGSASWKTFGRGVLTVDDYRRVLGIDWMNRAELSQAIPPIYTQFIGEQLLAHLDAGVAA